MNPKNNQRYRNNNDHPQYQNDQYPSQTNYKHYLPPKRGIPTWVLVIFGVIGGVGASAGAMYYLNKQQNTHQEPAAVINNNPQPAVVPPAEPIVVPMAQIIAVSPNYTTVDKPIKSCTTVESEVKVLNQKSGTTGAVVGGATGAVAGGVIGNQIKHGTGTIIGGVLGAATGALIGHQVQEANQPEYITKQEPVQVCKTEMHAVKHIANYDVKYSYNGQISTATSKKSYKVGSNVSYNKLQANFVQ